MKFKRSIIIIISILIVCSLAFAFKNNENQDIGHFDFNQIMLEASEMIGKYMNNENTRTYEHSLVVVNESVYLFYYINRFNSEIDENSENIEYGCAKVRKNFCGYEIEDLCYSGTNSKQESFDIYSTCERGMYFGIARDSRVKYMMVFNGDVLDGMCQFSEDKKFYVLESNSVLQTKIRYRFFDENFNFIGEGY